MSLVKTKKKTKRRFKRRTTFKGLSRRVRRLELDEEVKVNDLILNGAVDTTGSFNLMNGIAQGNTQSTRVGNTITITGFYARYLWNIGDSVNYCRLILVLDKQPNGATPIISDLINTSLGVSWLAPINWNNRQRFKFLKDEVMSLSIDSGQMNSTFFLKFKKPIRTIYSGTGSTITSISSNAIYAFLVTDSGAPPSPTHQAFYRLRYTDS